MMGKHDEKLGMARELIAGAYRSAQEAEAAYLAAVDTDRRDFYKTRIREESCRYAYYREMAKALFGMTDFELDCFVFDR